MTMTPGALLLTTLYFLLLNGGKHVLGHNCSYAAVHACLKPILDQSYDLGQAIVPTMNEEQLDDHCRRYDLYAECMEHVKPYCTAREKQSYEGIDDAYDYLCDTHKIEYLQHIDCFQTKDLHNEGAHCNNTLENKLSRLGPNIPAEYKRDRFCQYVEDYFDCVENAVTSFCGVKAAAWQRGMDELSLKPLMATMGCPNHVNTDNPEVIREEPTSTILLPLPASTVLSQAHELPDSLDRAWLMILIGIVVAFAVIIIAISIIMLFLIRRKKKMTREASQRHGDPELPPAYTIPVTAYGAGAQTVNTSNGGQAEALPEKGPGLLPPPYSGKEVDGRKANSVYQEISYTGSGST